MKALVIKGGWSWLGVVRNAGDVLDAPSEQWIDNRIADGNLVVRIPDPPTPVETAAITPAENASLPSQRASAKQRKS